MHACPCGTGKSYQDCCGLYHSQQSTAPTPETLMRSRYTAYSQANIDYIQQTMKSPAADGFNAEEARAWAVQVKWLDLKVVHSSQENNHGSVEFIARYVADGKTQMLHEISDFIYESGKWFYVDGKQIKSAPSEKTGRNDPCPCGSLRKYKKCCGVNN